MREMEDSLTKDPAGIYNRLDSALGSAPDSMSYYRNMLLKAKALFYTAEFDSMVPLMDCVRAYCDRSDDNAAIQGLYCQIYNMEGNLYGRKSEMDLSAKAFEKAYACGLAAGEREKLPYICINLADAYVRGSIVDLDNICFMGSNVVSGSAKGIVFATGNHTYLGTIAKNVAGHRAATAFDKGITKVSLLLIRFMLVMVPIVFLVNGITKGDWMEAFIFAISVAVGLTPEMLPMIVTANLSKGAMVMSRKKTIVKDLNAIQNFGTMNILCTDKTGTLTQDHIVLERHVNVDGTEDKENRILRHAYFNSYFQTGLKNLMDRAILSHVKELGLESLSSSYKKVDEIPFDFTRRRMSVVVEDRNGKRQIITKGAVEEMLTVCSFAEFGGKVEPLTDGMRNKAQKFVKEMNAQGMRVLALAQKSFLSKENNFAIEDEKEMVLIGYLAFLDPPKESASLAIKQLHEHGVEVKVLSGDNEAVVKAISRQVGINTSDSVTGPELENMSKEAKLEAVMKCSIFSKLTPMQKAEIIQLLQKSNNTVGFLGDGINDAAALRESDIGISVDSAVDIAKESADIILLEKDLIVLENGVQEGRKTFGNIVKYVKMTASSNFGNMFSVLAASAFLPFLPMLPIHLLIQNLLYDISQTTINHFSPTNTASIVNRNPSCTSETITNYIMNRHICCKTASVINIRSFSVR
jgi:Mg2+-importing ATPase